MICFLEEDDNDDGDEEVLFDSVSEIIMWMWYKMIVVFVEDFLDGFEFIVVFEGLFYRILFVVLEDSNGKYFFEIYKFWVILFLMILKFI